MAIRSVQDLIDTQQEMVAHMRKQTEAALKGGKAALNVVRQEKTRELAYLKERLAQTGEAKAETIARYDRQIGRQSEAIARLEQDLAEIEKHDQEKRPPGGALSSGKGESTTRRKK